MQFLLDYLKGILIGSGAILPGISSGVLCVVFGIYEKLVFSILNLFKDFRKHFIFLLPFILGGITGVLIISKLLKFLFVNFPMQTKYCFIGLILGSIPILLKKANQGKGFRLHYLFYLIITFLIGILSIKLEDILPYIINLELNQNYFLYLVIAGFLMSFGVVVPGVSSSVILMTLGVYDTYITSVAAVNLTVLFPMGIGILVGCILFLKLIQFLLNNHYISTFYGITGFVLGSVLILYPGFSFNLEGVVSIILFILSFAISLKFEKSDSTN